MKIVLATPLYPPDTAEPGLYVKELASRLREDHQVTIVAYAQIPEQVRDVTIIAISKKQPLLVRLFRYTLALWNAARDADVVYVQNGASVELPLGIISYLSRTPFVIRVGDESAHRHAERSAIFGSIERFAFSRAKSVIRDTSLPRPEILPFGEKPIAAFAKYEASWIAHLAMLNDIFAHAIQR